MFGFTFRAPEALVRPLLPAPLELLTQGGFGFWHVSFSEYERLRTGFFGGKTRGHVVVYSLYARSGSTVGLFPVRAETDIERLASWSDFPCARSTFSVEDDHAGTVDLFILETQYPVQVRIDTRRKPRLTDGSPFGSLSEAAQFLQTPACYLGVDSEGEVQLSSLERKPASTTTRLFSISISQWSFLTAFEPVAEVAFELKSHTCRFNTPRA